MSIKRIIPCLDVDEGKVVKGVKFEGIRDVGDPVEFARRYNADGADELAFLDIGASHKSRATMLDIVKKVAAEVSIPFCVGGGIRTIDDMRDTMKAGASKVSVCTSALNRPDLLREMADAYGSKCVVLSIDAKRVEGGGWHAFSCGGRKDTGLDAVQWAVRAAQLGAGEILVNSIDADGTGAGYDLELTRRIINAVNVPVIASGGAGNLEQIANVLLSTANPEMDTPDSEAPGADAALVASILHFGKTSIQEIKKYIEEKGVRVRR
ncbi:MAG: imidazole glycerol phosphate synthase subunit HisF [Treponema sp.]|nr:imidazole glycerol phosphate synthase subunit HisF [Treponema sp.]